MKESVYLIVLSQLLIGIGFSFLYMQHVRLVFESRTNVAQLTQLERESLMRREDALQYSFYKTLTDAPDFWSGYVQLTNNTDIEYPAKVNVLQHFYILPELVAGYFYHFVRRLHSSGYFPVFNCWRSNEYNNDVHEPHFICDTSSYPMQFYLEFVWLMGGIMLLVVYMYGSLLTENIFGGVYGVVSYIMFHNFVAKIYERPAARENFAFPIIALQMFCITLSFKRINDTRKYHSRFFTIFKLSLLTAAALLCWQFSAVLFTTQICLLMVLQNVTSIQNKLTNILTFDYAVSQMLAVFLAYWISHYNKQFLFSWQISLAFSMFLISLARVHKWRESMLSLEFPKTISLRTLTLELLLASSFQTKLIDFLSSYGLTKPQDNSFAHYTDLCAHWTMQIKSSFVTNLASCNPLYAPFEWTELWPLVKTLIIKPYCMYGVVLAAMFFRKLRKSYEPQTPNVDAVERAKKYLLEDYLEENHISMHDMSQKQTEESLKKCYDLLEHCGFDYERYKKEKAKLMTNKPNEHNQFMNDIKRLKAQIHKNNEELRKEQTKFEESTATTTGTGTETSDTIDREDTKDARNEKANENEEFETTTTTTTSSTTTTKNPSKNETKVNGTTPQTPLQQRNSNRKMKINFVDGYERPEANLLSLSYMYSFLQMAVFTLLGLTVKKLFFLSFTQGCIIAPTVCTKVWYRRHRNIFWSVTLVVFLCSMLDTGLINVTQEYYPKQRESTKHTKDELDNMLDWIKTNTEPDAVFAGPIEIIGTVHLTTKRPIVNHAQLEMRHINDRTEHVYSVYSRQQSNDIYNQYSQLKIQYLIIAIEQCGEVIGSECDILSIWDDIQPAYRKYPQFCAELLNKNVPSFVKVFANGDYIIVKMFSQTVQINLKHNKMPEMDM